MVSTHKIFFLLVSIFITSSASANPFGGIDFAPGEMPAEWLFGPIDQINFEDLFDGTFPFNLPAQSKTDIDQDQDESDSTESATSHQLYQQIDSAKLCASWNSFITPGIHVLELAHFDTETKTLSYDFYNQEGALVSKGEVKIEPAKERDVVFNDVIEKFPNQIGSVCVSGAENINGRISVYKKERQAEEPDFLAIWPLSTGRTGSQSVSLNTYFPYISPTQSSFVVSNWIELTNISSNSSSGTLTIFNQNGEVVQQTILTLEPHSRLDVPGHIIGANSVGSATWEPKSENDNFLLNNSRYYHDNASYLDSYLGATVVNSSNLSDSFSAEIVGESSEIIEFVNPSFQTAEIAIKTSDNKDGKSTLALTIEPHQSLHLVAKELLPNGGTFYASSSNPFSADLLSYSYSDNLALLSVASHGKLEKSSGTLTASYNTFLGYQCNLRVFNYSEQDETVRVIMLRDSGEVLLGDLFTISSQLSLEGEPYQIEANSSINIDLCQHEAANHVGTVSVFSDSATADLSATMLRKTADLSSADYIKLTPLQ